MKQFSLEEYIKNPSRKVVTRDGRSVRFICTDAKGSYPIIALVDYKDHETSYNYTNDGITMDSDWGFSRLDLFFATEKHEGWINLYRADTNVQITTYMPYDSKEKAIEESKKLEDSYIATIKIEWEE